MLFAASSFDLAASHHLRCPCISLSVQQPSRNDGPGLGAVIQHCFAPTGVLDLEEILRLPAINESCVVVGIEYFLACSVNG